MHKQKGYVNLEGVFGFLIGLGIVIGVIFAIVVPWLWGFLKPYIHAITA